jgi:hypothetical protein
MLRENPKWQPYARFSAEESFRANVALPRINAEVAEGDFQ